MSRFNFFVVVLLILTGLPASTSVSAQSSSVTTVSNGIYDIFVQSSGIRIGTYTIRTGASHPVTLNMGQPQSILYGGDDASPGTSYNTIRSYTSSTDYVTQPNRLSNFTVINLDAYSTGTVILGTNEIQTTWQLPGPPATPDKLEIIQSIRVQGTTFYDSTISVNVFVTNLGTNPVALGARYLWDVEIGLDDGPTFIPENANDTENAPILTEVQITAPTLYSYFIQDNDRNPSPPTFGVHGTITGPQSFGPSVPSALQFASWSPSYSRAFDYTVNPTTEISTGGDSAVIYLFGHDLANARTILELETLSLATYIFAAPADADQDGDRLLDSWETTDTDMNGDGIIDVGPSVGSDPNKKDIYVEVDWMAAANNHPAHQPDPQAIQKVVAAFAAKNINLHVDVGPSSIDYVTGNPWGQNSNGNEIPHEDVIGDPSNSIELLADWERLRVANFGHSDRIFRHTMFVHEAKDLDAGGTLLGSAVSYRDSLGGYLPGQYLIVALGTQMGNVGTVVEQAGTFMHELGHTLGLNHGGSEAQNYKPNYLSVMNYSFATNGLNINGVAGQVDYSRFDLPDLAETNLVESNGLNDARVASYKTKYRAIGICNPFDLRGYYVETNTQPINWDCDLGTDDQPVQVDINQPHPGEGPGLGLTQLTSWDDWSNLNFKAGNIGASVASPLPITSEAGAYIPEEITFEEDLYIQRSSDPRVQLSKTVNLPSVQPGGIVTYTINMLNIDGQAANNVVITDTLPVGFTYVTGSTSGATTNNPVINGQTLSWSPFLVPANGGVLTLTFQATASQAPGIYFNNVGGTSSNAFVVPTGDTAQVEVISTPPNQSLYLSLNNVATVGGVAAQDVDILSFDGTTWSLFFDGSDVGISTTNQDMNEFHILDTDTILMTFDEPITLGTLTADPWDVVRFDATSLGDNTAGTFSLYLDGNDVGLDTTNEYIDGLHVLPDGRVLISTDGNPTVSGLTGTADEDILAFTSTTLGDVTSGTWEMYFDGSDVGLADSSSEDTDALDMIDGNLYLSTRGDFSVTGVAGASNDIFVCSPTSLGSVTSCNFQPALYFDGDTWGLGTNNIDALGSPASGPTPTATPTDTPTATATPSQTFTPSFTPTIGPSPTNTNTPLPTDIPLPTNTPSPTPVQSGQPLYLSLGGGQTVGGVVSQDVDILYFDGSVWSLFFDASDVGIDTSGQNLNDFAIVDSDTLLLTFNDPLTIAGLTVDPADIVQFNATSLGSVTAGTFSMYFDGIDVGLDTSSEAIDALDRLADGRILISTNGNPTVPGVSGAADEDILAFTPTTLGDTTSGTWLLHFDGSDAGLADSGVEDVDALAVHSNGDIHLSTIGEFAVTGVSGFNEDVFVCTPTSLGDVTACTYLSSLYFDGDAWGLDANNVDGIHLTLP